MTPKRIALLAAVALAVPGIADAASFSIEALYGLARPPAADFDAAVSGTANDQDLSDDSAQIVGGTVLLTFGLFELGAIIDATLPDQGPDQTAIGALAGIRLGDKLRLDLLGEIGGQRFGNAFEDTDVVTGSTSDQWLMYVGLRPGLAYKFDLRGGGAGIILGLWGFARWDLTDGTTQATGGDVPSAGEVDLGGTTIGATARLGIEF
jgi:hypothetical protein